jgi:hypothetical protein
MALSTVAANPFAFSHGLITYIDAKAKSKNFCTLSKKQNKNPNFFLNVKRRRKIRLKEGNEKCRHLTNLPVKGLCGRCLSVFIDW